MIFLVFVFDWNVNSAIYIQSLLPSDTPGRNKAAGDFVPLIRTIISLVSFLTNEYSRKNIITIPFFRWEFLRIHQLRDQCIRYWHPNHTFSGNRSAWNAMVRVQKVFKHIIDWFDTVINIVLGGNQQIMNSHVRVSITNYWLGLSVCRRALPCHICKCFFIIITRAIPTSGVWISPFNSAFSQLFQTETSHTREWVFQPSDNLNNEYMFIQREMIGLHSITVYFLYDVFEDKGVNK